MRNPTRDGQIARGLSRRSFLSHSAVTTVGGVLTETALAVAGPARAQTSEPGLVGPDAAPIALTVNGVERTVQAEPRSTLAEVLRGPLGLTGTKVPCDRGACSACTVWLDGEPVDSCMMLAVDVGGRAVTTIEGLAKGDDLHPVQAAFIEHDALQCGFCTPGMVMSCAALLQRNPHPTADDVKGAIAGHICRCGAYPHIVEAVLAAAQTAKA